MFIYHPFYSIHRMAKKLFKGPNKLIWGVLLLAIALFLFYMFKKIEGFQNNQTVSVGPPTTIPAKQPPPTQNTVVPDNNVDNTMNTTTMPDLTPSIKSTPKQSTPNPSTSIALVRAKLDELKSLIDTM